MLCDNCGKKEANVRYSENINGRKKELSLCEECSKKLGITREEFSLPIDFSNFFGEFLEDFGTTEFMPLLSEMKTLTCGSCGYTFEDIINTGKLGCGNCYDVFEERLDPILRRMQGANRHTGRIGKVLDHKIEQKMVKQENIEGKKQEEKSLSKLESKQQELKQAIKEERYEDAAKIRDEIKKLEKEDKQ
ncbi:MAG: hypothetical protein HFJ33_01185 [Clostridia bacterium]|nr:hypothetical protein [Clostridia bacterium]